MKFKFSKDLQYQLDAIHSVAGIFEVGGIYFDHKKEFGLRDASKIEANNLEFDPKKILEGVQLAQRVSNIEVINNLESMDFSIEMETGTGKTYVYLRTIFELNSKYNLKKFIVLVPSVAIREGVLKTIEQTREHFRGLYNVGFGAFAYDSDKLNQVRDFVQSNDIQIMIMTIQSFNSDTKVLRQTPDRFHGERPIDLIAQTRPVVIMDEPQNMGSELSKASISDLNPLFKLRYSATHKEVHNLVYRLTPVDAYKNALVKKIAVYGVKENNTGAFVFNVREIETKSGQNPKAHVLIEVKSADGIYLHKEVVLNSGDDVYKKSGKNEKYLSLEVYNIDARHNRVELSDGGFYTVDTVSNNIESIYRTQIRETIRAHFEKQQEVGDQIKVLSLFFIDKVDNYINQDSILRKLFIEEYQKLQKNYTRFVGVDAHTVHKGYFASKKSKGVTEYKDGTTGSSKEDREAYNLIMKNKEQLLSFTEPVSFVFSHSALREGWDNPNIFQICTLRETQDTNTKRQQIGRGLRLPVNIHGDRVYDPAINVLTVIANSSYEEYAGSLQQEFMEAGYRGDIDIQNKREDKITVTTNKNLELQDFKDLWARISKRTRYSLEVLSDRLVEKSIEKINEITTNHIRVVVERGQIFFDDEGNFESARDTTSAGYKIDYKVSIPNIINRIEYETGVTKRTIYNILSRVNNLDLIFDNSEEYVRGVILVIKAELSNLLVNEGLKYEPTGDYWEIGLLFEDLKTYPSKTLASNRSVYSRVVFDSTGEREFAERLENSPRVKVYSKLPRGFFVDTPLGNYVPDWAIVWDTGEGEKLYLVRETKFGYDNLEQQLTYDELQKILCAQKHFESIGVDYKVAQDIELRDLL